MQRSLLASLALIIDVFLATGLCGSLTCGAGEYLRVSGGLHIASGQYEHKPANLPDLFSARKSDVRQLTTAVAGPFHKTVNFPVQANTIDRQAWESQIIFEQRPIPAGVRLGGHAAGSQNYNYRIPSLLVTKRGSILAFSERRLGLHDHAQNDIVLKRGTDGGRNWSDEIVAFEDGMHSINDPLTVQLNTGRILLMFARFPYGRHSRDAGWIKMADRGYDDPSSNVLTFLCHSDDDGQTWSTPRDISRQVKHPKLLNANTPGAMLQLTKGPHAGRIVTGLWGSIPGGGSQKWGIVVATSDDNGQSWKRTELLEDRSGKGFPNECQVAEAANGDLVLISRNQEGELFRKKSISRDGGDTWTPLDIDRGLPSVACMGSLIRGPTKADGSWDLWASFPSAEGRQDGRIVTSRDHGQTWQVMKIIHGPFAYSALQVSADEKSLLCLYESDNYKTQTLLSIPFDALTEPLAQAALLPARRFAMDTPRMLPPTRRLKRPPVLVGE